MTISVEDRAFGVDPTRATFKTTQRATDWWCGDCDMGATVPITAPLPLCLCCGKRMAPKAIRMARVSSDGA